MGKDIYGDGPNPLGNESPAMAIAYESVCGLCVVGLFIGLIAALLIQEGRNDSTRERSVNQ